MEIISKILSLKTGVIIMITGANLKAGEGERGCEAYDESHNDFDPFTVLLDFNTSQASSALGLI